MKKILLSMSLLASLFSFSQVADQPNPLIGSTEPLEFIDASKSVTIYQSFTSGLTGELQKVELGLSFGSGEATVEIFEGSFEDGNLGADPLGTTTFQVPASGFSEAFFSDVLVDKDTKYSIRISGFSGTAAVFGESINAPYLGGQYTNSTGTEFGDSYFKTYVLVATGLFDFSNNSNAVSVFPNPATTNSVSIGQVSKEILVYDAIGNLVLEIKNSDKVDVSSLENGLYTLKTELGNSTFLVKK